MPWNNCQKPAGSDNHTVQLSDHGNVSNVTEITPAKTRDCMLSPVNQQAHVAPQSTLTEEDGNDVCLLNFIANDEHLQKRKYRLSSTSPMEPASVELECCSSDGGTPLAISPLLPLVKGTEAMSVPTTKQFYLIPTQHEMFPAISSGSAKHSYNSLLDKQNSP